MVQVRCALAMVFLATSLNAACVLTKKNFLEESLSKLASISGSADYNTPDTFELAHQGAIIIREQHHKHHRKHEHQIHNTNRQTESKLEQPLRQDDKRFFMLDLLRMLGDQKHNRQGNNLLQRLFNAESPSKKGPISSNSSNFSTSVNEDHALNNDSNAVNLALEQLVKEKQTFSFDSRANYNSLDRLIALVLESLKTDSLMDAINRYPIRQFARINCLGLGLKPDNESNILPNFYLYKSAGSLLESEEPLKLNYELADISQSETTSEQQSSKVADFFEPNAKTIVLIHGYLAGFLLADGLNNIKDQILSLNAKTNPKSGYNVIVVDWYIAANPAKRSNYVMASVNTQIIGKLIGKFLLNLKSRNGLSIERTHLVAHSLGCHVASFAGKFLKSQGEKLAKITHLDPVGLCFGNVFSKPEYRLAPDDALETDAIHVAMNLLDNPLDGAQANFLVNGGRDQLGCSSEYTNNTISSVSLALVSESEFKPCSHLRALSFLEDDHSSELEECQFVGYQCEDYATFLDGKCAQCDATSDKCKLMGLDLLQSDSYNPLIRKFRTAVNDDNDDLGEDLPPTTIGPASIGVSPNASRAGNSQQQEPGKMYYLGTSSISTYCVNYYQFRMLFARSDIAKLIRAEAPPTRELPVQNQTQDSFTSNKVQSGSRYKMKMGIKLMATSGDFFKGFGFYLDASELDELREAAAENNFGKSIPMVEITLLLNSTHPKPVKTGAAIVNVRSGQIIVPHSIELNYMSNINFA